MSKRMASCQAAAGWIIQFNAGSWMQDKKIAAVKAAIQTVDKVPHFCAGFFYAKYRKLQCLCRFWCTFLV